MQVDSWAPYFHYRNGKQLVANQKFSLISLTDTFSVQLQLSACLPHQFTCHNGKCVSMNSRCDNVEVITLFKVFVPSFDRIVTTAAMRRCAGWFRSTKKNILKTNHPHLHKAGQAFRYGKVRICVDVKSQTSLWVCGSGWSVGLVGSFGLADLEGQWVCGNSCKIQGAEGWGGLEREGQET